MSDMSSGADVFVDTNEDGKRPGLLVVLCGLITTAIALVIVYFMQSNDIHPMGFYLMLIIPVGAILVGIVAGSGYAIGSWWAGAKLGGGLLMLVLALQLFAYFAAQYIEFNNYQAMLEGSKDQIFQQIEQESGGQIMDDAAREATWQNIMDENGSGNFLSYFDMMTQTFAFDGDNGPGNPLGLWGYGIRLLEILGFCLGSLIGPLMLMAAPYCSECQIYKKTKQIGLMPAGVKPRKVKKKDAEGQQAYQEELETALQGGLQLVEEMAELAKAGNSMEFVEMLTQLKESKKDIAKQTSRIIVNLIYCPGCNAGNLTYQMQTGFGEEIATTEIADYVVDKNFVREINMSL